MRDIEPIRAALEKFTQEIEKEHYDNLSGQKEDLNTSAIYGKYNGIFTDETLVEEVKNRRVYQRGPDRMRMNYLYSLLLSSYLGRKNTELADKISTLETRSEVEVEGKKIPFRYSAVSLANEPDHNKREVIDRARDQVFAEVNPLRLEVLNKDHELAEALGYGNYVDMCMDASGIDLFGLRKQMLNVLNRTDRLYSRYFKLACSNILKINQSDVRKHDIGFLFRAKNLDRLFGQENMMKALNVTLDGIGLPLSENPNIRVDAEAREKKSPRAFCSPINVPGQVMLCIMPKGGLDDYRALFHEMGHSQHFSNVNPGTPFEFKYLGDNSVTEAFAFLFEHLVADKAWLTSTMNMGDEDVIDVAQFLNFQTLYMVRRYAAKLIYELELHSGAKEPEKLYAKILEDALKFKHPEIHYLYDVDPGFYAANYLRAWMFEVQLRTVLDDRFGSTWWKEKECGRFLKELWSSGQKYTADQHAKGLGYYGIDEYPMVKELERKLRY
jgi:oligoendopeptidase F